MTMHILNWRERVILEGIAADQATQSIDESTNNACQDIFNMSPRERLRKAGILSGNFWLAM
jgi:hypothetical protein